MRLPVLAASVLMLSSPAQSDPCDLALIVAMDVSGSVDANEWELQRSGTAKAVMSPRVWGAIRSGIHGRIAVAVTQWSDQPQLALDWLLIEQQDDLVELAGAIESMPRQSNGSTGVGNAVLHAVGLFASAPCLPLRMVVDLSSDGASNVGPHPHVARKAADAADVTVNALIIHDGSEPHIEAYYRDNVIAGPGAFVLVAEGFHDIARALTSKLSIEIGASSPIMWAGAQP